MRMKRALAGVVACVAARVGKLRVRACFNQVLMVIMINVPMISFGLAMGWVSLATGATGATGAPSAGGEVKEHEEDVRVVAAASTTFVASLLGVPLSARALAAGRKTAVIATSAVFVACWALKLVGGGGGWWLVAARACAGLGGAGAWSVAPLLAREMCEARMRGAAVSALVLANNLGMLLMYLAADAHLSHSTVLWSCLVLSAAHCVLFLFVPESPSYLAAHGKLHEARSALAWLRGVARDSPALDAEMCALPAPDRAGGSPLQLVKDMLSCPRRRRAFIVIGVVMVGQESFGVLALLQFAERVFVLARSTPDEELALATPSRHAVLLGVAQLVASALALYLVEKLGRKRLLVWCGLLTGGGLLLAAAAVRWRGGAGAAWLLAAAVFADAAGLQPVPYAMLTDMFHYHYRACAVSVLGAASWLGNALEVLLFPALVAARGLAAALALGGALALALAGAAAALLPETRGREPDQIYDAMCPGGQALHSAPPAPRPPRPPLNDFFITHL